MADVNKEIALKVTTDLGQTTAQFQNATKELQETQKALVELALAGKQGSEEFLEMENRAGQLRDAIGSVNQRVNTLASSTPKLDLVRGAMQGIAGGFAAAQGAAALFGSESEDLQKAILKTQGAMSLLNGVQQISITLDKNQVVAIQAKVFAQRAYAVAVRLATLATRSFTAALAATGIGALVIALGYLITKLFESTDATEKNTKAIEKAREAQKLLDEQIQNTIDLKEAEIKQMETAGETAQKTATARLKLISDELIAIEKSINQQKVIIDALEGFEDKTEQNRRKRLLMAQKLKQADLQNDLLIQQNIIAKANEEEAKQQDEKNKLAREKAKIAAQIQLELSQELQNLQAQNIADEEARALAQLELERSRARKQLQEKKASNALLIEFDKQSEIQRKEITDKAQAERDAKAKEESEKALANAKIVSDALQQARLDSIKNEFDRAQAELKIQRQAKIEELKLAGASAEEINAVKKSFADQSVQIEKDKAKQEKQVQEEATQARFELTLGGLKAIGDLAASFAGKSEEQQKRAFNVQKAANIAMATIETYLSAASAYKSQLLIPTPDAPIRAAIAAGVAIASGLARVAAISKTQFKSTAPPTNTGAGGSIPTGGGGGQQPPAAFNPNVTPTNPTGQPNPQGGQNGTTRVIVVESDIRRVTTRVDAAERFATFGN
jgi:hypothetical protein